MPAADNIDLALSLAVPHAFIFSCKIDRNIYFLPSSSTSHSSDPASILPSSCSLMFIWWCQRLGKACMRMDEKECYLDKLFFSGKCFFLTGLAHREVTVLHMNVMTWCGGGAQSNTTGLLNKQRGRQFFWGIVEFFINRRVIQASC